MTAHATAGWSWSARATSGLPLALRAVEVGHDVVGFDVDKSRVDRLRKAESFIDDVSDADLAEALATGRYTPSDDPGDLAGFRTAVVSVPTPLRDGRPDLQLHRGRRPRCSAGHLHPRRCVVLESTTYPGTTEEIFAPILEAGSGLRAGADFHLGYSPERIDPSNPTWGLRNTPKIVSGVDEASAAAVAAFYGDVVDRTVAAPGTARGRAGEAAGEHLPPRQHRARQRARDLLPRARHRRLVGDRAAATKPFGFMPFTPGPGVGGHCLPIDPSYLSWQVRRRARAARFRFVEIANDVNDNMPDYVVSRVVEHLNRTSPRGATAAACCWSA